MSSLYHSVYYFSPYQQQRKQAWTFGKNTIWLSFTTISKQFKFYRVIYYDETYELYSIKIAFIYDYIDKYLFWFKYRYGIEAHFSIAIP